MGQLDSENTHQTLQILDYKSNDLSRKRNLYDKQRRMMSTATHTGVRPKPYQIHINSDLTTFSAQPVRSLSKPKMAALQSDRTLFFPMNPDKWM